MQDKFILLVEDDDEDQVFFMEVVAKIDKSIHVRTAVNGEEALQLLHNTPVLPDAMFLDINLPGMNGLKLLKTIKASPQYNAIPAIILSSSFTAQEINTAMGTGASAYIIKPDSLPELQRFISGALANLPGEQPGAPGGFS